MLPSGGEVLGRYQLLLELASGGMATAYIARAQGAAGFERLVVIKRVHSHLATNKEFIKMFVDEAKLASLVRHPGVVPVIDVVQSKGELFLVLEYVESVSLSVLLATARATKQRLDPSVVSRIMLDTLAGLHAAHEATDMQGQPLCIVHRDVSPQNIVVGVDGASRLIDFGIAKAAGRLTKTTGGVMKGKLGYMAPEQAKQKPVDRRSDIYAAGIVLHEALTGQRLFAGEDAGDILLNMLIAEIPQLTDVVVGLPKAMDDLMGMALASDPNDRFDNAAAFQVALENALPPAPTREIAKVVGELASEVLASRRDALRDMMGGSHPDPLPDSSKALTLAVAKSTVRELTPAAAPRDEPVTDVSHVLPRPIRPGRIAMGGAFLVGAAVAGVLAIGRVSSDPQGSVTDDETSQGAARSSSASAHASPSTGAPTITPLGEVSASASSAPTSVRAPPTKAPATAPPRRPPAATGAAPAAPPPPPPPPSLQDNPY